MLQWKTPNWFIFTFWVAARREYFASEAVGFIMKSNSQLTNAEARNFSLQYDTTF